jgi:hypothetical protein
VYHYTAINVHDTYVLHVFSQLRFQIKWLSAAVLLLNLVTASCVSTKWIVCVLVGPSATATSGTTSASSKGMGVKQASRTLGNTTFDILRARYTKAERHD